MIFAGMCAAIAWPLCLSPVMVVSVVSLYYGSRPSSCVVFLLLLLFRLLFEFQYNLFNDLKIDLRILQTVRPLYTCTCCMLCFIMWTVGLIVEYLKIVYTYFALSHCRNVRMNGPTFLGFDFSFRFILCNITIFQYIISSSFRYFILISYFHV